MFLQSLLLSMVVASPLSLASSILESDQRNYEQALMEANTALMSAQRNMSCPGVGLALSCGNKKCEPKKGEDKKSCAADCVKGEIRSYNHQTICDQVKTIYRPSNVQEVQDAVLEATNNGLKIRVVGATHSANSQLCNKGAIISMEKLNQAHQLETFQGEETVVVDPGMTIGDLAEWLHLKGKSLGYTMIGFRGVTVGGSTATGSHGSSSRHSSVMASLIRSMTIVQADGSLKEYHEGNTDPFKWKALRTSLGMLGVIAQMRLKVAPQFNLRVQVTYGKDKDLFKPNGALNLVKDCDWGQIQWFPGVKRYMRACAYHTLAPAEPGATNTLLQPDLPNWIVKPFKAVLQYGACSKGLNCLIERVRWWQFKLQPPFKKENSRGKLKNTRDAIGPSHRITSSSFTDKADGFFQMDWELAVPGKNVHNAMKAVRDHVKKNKICLPLIGVFIRFTKAEDTTLLAHSSVGGDFKKGEPVAFIEMPVYLPSGFDKDRSAAYDKKYEDFAKLLIDDHGARAHWGKNREWIFKKQKDMNLYGEKMRLFQNVLNDMDPHGVFANRYGENMGLMWPGMTSKNVDGPCSGVIKPRCTKDGRLYINYCHALKDGKSEYDLLSPRACQVVSKK